MAGSGGGARGKRRATEAPRHGSHPAPTARMPLQEDGCTGTDLSSRIAGGERAVASGRGLGGGAQRLSEQRFGPLYPRRPSFRDSFPVPCFPDFPLWLLSASGSTAAAIRHRRCPPADHRPAHTTRQTDPAPIRQRSLSYSSQRLAAAQPKYTPAMLPIPLTTKAVITPNGSPSDHPMAPKTLMPMKMKSFTGFRVSTVRARASLVITQRQDTLGSCS